MLLKYFYDPKLAHASYLIGCQRSRTAMIVDPGRDISGYLDVAQANGLRIEGVAETHIHADYVSGARELADRVGAKLFVSDEGPAEWKYQYVAPYDHQLLRDGDCFSVGNVQFQVMHTPGHTPESLSFLLTDLGGGATTPMGIFTGDFVFVGSVGRPDLLEEAAGIFGSAKVGAHELFASVQKFKELPDYFQIWPAHGAGSACGKGLGAVPSSTVGYEKRFNPALQIDDEEAFVDYILSDQPEAPTYFAVMKRVNKEGPELLGPVSTLNRLEIADFMQRDSEAILLDLTPKEGFGNQHVPGSCHIPVSSLAAWAGWLLDYNRPAYLIGDAAEIPEALRVLRKIGYDRILGYFERAGIVQAGLATESTATQSPRQLQAKIESGEVQLWDVRSNEEWKAGHLPEARHVFLGKLPQVLRDSVDERPIVVQCQAGMRSAIAASLIQATGRVAVDMAGGYLGWRKAGLPVVGEATATCSLS